MRSTPRSFVSPRAYRDRWRRVHPAPRNVSWWGDDETVKSEIVTSTVNREEAMENVVESLEQGMGMLAISAVEDLSRDFSRCGKRTRRYGTTSWSNAFGEHKFIQSGLRLTYG